MMVTKFLRLLLTLEYESAARSTDFPIYTRPGDVVTIDGYRFIFDIATVVFDYADVRKKGRMTDGHE